jgi:sarcosine oxidase
MAVATQRLRAHLDTQPDAQLSEHYQAVVVGLGGMGSAALAQLAQRGARVLGLEQYHPAHALGSSHGGSRIIRKAYYEDPAYVPLVLRAYELWHDLEQRTGTTLLIRTGGLMAGYEGCEIVEGSTRSARAHGLAHELLDAVELRRRFPALRPRADEVALYEPDAGVLFPEQCVLAHLQVAIAAGAEARFGVPVLGWRATEAGVTIQTGAREIDCERLILTAGPWLGQVAPALGRRLQVERNVMHWFEPQARADRLSPSALPIYILERRGLTPFYGIPYLDGQGIKAAFHYSGQDATPDKLDRNVGQDEVEAMRAALLDWIPDAAGDWRGSTVCMYTNTPDKHFIVGHHPEHEQVLIAGGFSGHGFKFCSAIGDALADLATTGSAAQALDLFSPTRFEG